jgi:DNA-binding transcriptional LysR family regulator
VSIKTAPDQDSENTAGPVRDLFLHDWDGLRAFLDVARSRSLNRAASALNLQHTTLNRRIKALEESIGRPLLARGPRGIQLTPDGVELLSVLERFNEDLTSVGRWITRGVRGMERPISVSIACTEGLAAYWLTQFLSQLRRRNVAACYNIHTSLAAIPEKGKAFHASVQMNQPADAISPEQIGHVHFMAMASKEYLKEMGPYQPGDHPGKHRWIEYAPFRVMSGSWEAWFQREKIEVAPFTVTNSLVTTVNAVLQGGGIGLLPTYMAITEPNLTPVNAGLRLKFPIWLTTDRQAEDTPELSAALGLIRAAIDPGTMPWFRDKIDPAPDYAAWRAILDEAISRLD